MFFPEDENPAPRSRRGRPSPEASDDPVTRRRIGTDNVSYGSNEFPEHSADPVNVKVRADKRVRNAEEEEQ